MKYVAILVVLGVFVGCGTDSKIGTLNWSAGKTVQFNFQCENVKAVAGCGNTAFFERRCNDSLALESVTDSINLYAGETTVQPWSIGINIFNVYNKQGDIIEDCNLSIDNIPVGKPQFYSTIHNGRAFMIDWCEQEYDVTCPDAGWRMIKSADRDITETVVEVTHVVEVTLTTDIGVDNDGDGYFTNGDPKDCDDGDPFVYPGANGLDDNCEPLWDGPVPRDYTYATVSFETDGVMYCWQGDDNGIQIEGEIPHAFGTECFPGQYILSPYGVHYNIVHGSVQTGTWDINDGLAVEYNSATPVWWTVGSVSCMVTRVDFTVPNVGVSGYNTAFIVSGTDTDEDGEFDQDVQFKTIDGEVICR